MSRTKGEQRQDAGGLYGAEDDRVVVSGAFSDSAIASFKLLSVERRQRVFIITFNRPEKRNALNRAMYLELIRAINLARADDAITTIVLTGAGDYFTSGLDLTQFASPESKLYYCRTANFVVRLLLTAIITCPKVLVALVNGPCIGIGFTLCGLCDVVYCTERARFVAPFSRVGLCAEASSSYTFPSIMGRSWANDVLIFGRELNATEALQSHFVSRIFNANELDVVFWPLLLEYAALPAESLRISKRLISGAEHQRIIAAMQDELKEIKRLRYGETFQNTVDTLLARSANKSKL